MAKKGVVSCLFRGVSCTDKGIVFHMANKPDDDGKVEEEKTKKGGEREEQCWKKHEFINEWQMKFFSASNVAFIPDHSSDN